MRENEREEHREKDRHVLRFLQLVFLWSPNSMVVFQSIEYSGYSATVLNIWLYFVILCINTNQCP